MLTGQWRTVGDYRMDSLTDHPELAVVFVRQG
jgi:hypothetical protein